MIFLDDPDAVADIMEKLVKASEGQTLMAYQIAFDLYENASQQFLSGIRRVLRSLAPEPLDEPEGQGTDKKTETTTETPRYASNMVMSIFHMHNSGSSILSFFCPK